MSSGRLLLNKTLIFASLKIYLDFDDVLSDRDDDASCGDGYVPGSKIEQEESETFEMGPPHKRTQMLITLTLVE